jgi:MFS family permease
VIYLRRRVSEPAVFVAARRVPHSAPHPFNFVRIFSRANLRTLALASLLAIGIQGAYYAVVTWLPTYLRSELQLSVAHASGHLLVLIAGSFLGYLTGAAAMDRMGRRKAFITFAVLSAATSHFYFSGSVPPTLILFAGFPLGFTVSGMIGGLGAFLAELFPTPIRGSAQGFTYNFGRVVAASFPPLIGAFSSSYSLPSMMAAFAMGSFACVIVAVLLLPETLGRSLEPIDSA